MAQIVEGMPPKVSGIQDGDNSTRPSDPGGTGGVGGGGLAPPTNVLKIYDPEHRQDNTDIEIQWSWIQKTQKLGKITPNARVGDVTRHASGESYSSYDLGDGLVYYSTGLILRKQVTPTTHEEMYISGLVHVNNVYRGKQVIVDATQALLKDGKEEGFIIPLNKQVLDNMSLKDVTQMAYNTNHLVFNCYVVVKKKWYQQTWFQIVLIIVAIIIIVVSWGSAGPAVGSAYAALWSSITAAGISWVVANIIVATVSVLLGMLLTKMLTPALTDLFGEKWGAVIAAIVSMLVMNWASTGSMLGSVNSTTGTVTAAELIQGSIAAVNLYGKYMQGKLMELDIPGKMKEMQSEYEARMEEVKKLTKELLGTNTDLIDIEGLLESTRINIENSSTFLTRTLMTGNDVVDVTSGLITDFAEAGLYLPTSA